MSAVLRRRYVSTDYSVVVFSGFGPANFNSHRSCTRRVYTLILEDTPRFKVEAIRDTVEYLGDLGLPPRIEGIAFLTVRDGETDADVECILGAVPQFAVLSDI